MSLHLESPDNSKILDATNNSMFGAQSQLSMPQLTIPPLPPMVAIPKPKPVKKLPPVGYDMRSLRKQMDILYNEIEDRAKWQDLVFKQNDALWNYTASLLESNQVNVETMKQQVNDTLLSYVQDLYCYCICILSIYLLRCQSSILSALSCIEKEGN